MRLQLEGFPGLESKELTLGTLWALLWEHETPLTTASTSSDSADHLDHLIIRSLLTGHWSLVTQPELYKVVVTILCSFPVLLSDQ